MADFIGMRIGPFINIDLPITIYNDQNFVLNHAPQKIGIWVENPTPGGFITDLTVTLTGLFWVYDDGNKRVDRLSEIDTANRLFVEGDKDLSAPIYAGKTNKRLIYLWELKYYELVLLLRNEYFASKYDYETNISEAQNSPNNSFFEYRSRFEISLLINGNIGSSPIEPMPFKMWIEYDSRFSKWYFDHGWKESEIVGRPDTKIFTRPL